MVELHKNLVNLGNSAVNKPLYEQSTVNPGFLEWFPSPFSLDNKNGVDGHLHIEFPEFSSTCPKTGQPDSANIIIDYIPDERCVESKSLKLYFFSFRNYGCFMEAITNMICNDLVDLLQPKWIKVTGKFAARGGLPLHPTAEWCKDSGVKTAQKE